MTVKYGVSKSLTGHQSPLLHTLPGQFIHVSCSYPPNPKNVTSYLNACPFRFSKLNCLWMTAYSLKFWNAVLENDGKGHMDESYETLGSIIQV